MQLKLKNIPVPEAYLLAIALSLILQLFFPLRIFSLHWIGHLLGWPLAMPGILLSLWAASEAGEMSIASPDELITTGPYAYSRNPMYLGWALIYFGYSLILNSIWSLVFLPVAFAYIHFFGIRAEEETLRKKFAEQYDEYCNKVRRYI